MLNRKLAFFHKISFFFLVALVVAGCASMQKPQGGPRDLTPPKLLLATPQNMTRNFKSKQIVLEFDEFFKLANPYQEITISPAPEKPPEYLTKKKNLVIDLKDTLLKNTTYVINFGKAVSDVNEGNVLKNFTYVFSTGNHIDSLSISGNVINSITQEKEKDATVMLFTLKDDSLRFGKKKPIIFATTDSAGNFSLNNLREDTYRIYALKETSPDKIFNSDGDLIAFQKNPIVLTKDTSGIKLSLFKQVATDFRVAEKKFDPDGKFSMVFNRPLIKPSVKILYPPNLDNQKLVEFSKTKDSAYVYLRNMDFDSLRVAVLDNNKPLDTVYQLKQRKESFQRVVSFSYNLNKDNKLKPGTDLIITPSLPGENFERSLITFTEDSVSVGNYTIQKDTSGIRNYTLKYRWRAGSRYQLIFNDGAFTTIYGDKNKRAGIPFQADKPENYSQLTLKVVLPDTARQYVIELLGADKNVLRTDVVTKSGPIVYRNILTAKYKVRVIYDANKNGRWDSGNVKLREQPENIWVYDKEITLRPNWEAEEPLEIPKEQTNP
ncbi:hypothetical protein FFF34_012660 [Inquilinus sp. KBS0705]|nr:hypothetical protein FFF34_012660 [Inquilinus sp. KBS0705]